MGIRRICLGIAALMWIGASAQAGGLVFSKDGEYLFLPVSDDAGERTALRVNLAEKTFTTFNPQDYGAPQNVWYRTVSDSGFLIGAAEGTLYATDLDKKKSVKLATLPAGMWVSDLAYEPGGQGVVVIAYKAADEAKGGANTEVFYIPKGATQAKPVRTRRVSAIDAVAYGPNNRLYFAALGDLWSGQIRPEDAHAEPKDYRMILEGERVAPLATREASHESGTTLGVRQVALAGNRILVAFSGLTKFGFGMADNNGMTAVAGTMKIPEINTNMVDGADEMMRYARRTIGYLESLKKVEDTSGLAFTAQSPVGDRAAIVDMKEVDMLDTPKITVVLMAAEGDEVERVEVTRGE